MKNAALATSVCLAAAAVFALLAVLYAAGTIDFMASSGATHHYKHTVLFGALAVLSLVGANFARSRDAL